MSRVVTKESLNLRSFEYVWILVRTAMSVWNLEDGSCCLNLAVSSHFPGYILFYLCVMKSSPCFFGATLQTCLKTHSRGYPPLCWMKKGERCSFYAAICRTRITGVNEWLKLHG